MEKIKRKKTKKNKLSFYKLSSGVEEESRFTWQTCSLRVLSIPWSTLLSVFLCFLLLSRAYIHKQPIFKEPTQSFSNWAFTGFNLFSHSSIQFLSFSFSSFLNWVWFSVEKTVILLHLPISCLDFAYLGNFSSFFYKVKSIPETEQVRGFWKRERDMAARNLEKMASIDAQLRLLAPAKVSEDDKLIEYDALLLDRFLDILQDLHGEGLRETVMIFFIIIIIIIFFLWTSFNTMGL